MRAILDYDLGYYVIPLAMMAGVQRGLESASSRSMGETLPLWAILAIAVVAGPIGGIISLYIGGAFLGWVGNRLGGQGEDADVRAALAWSSVPNIPVLTIWGLQILLFGIELFQNDSPRLASSPLLSILSLGITLVQLILGIWMVVLLVSCLAEAHRFSIWKSLATLAIAFLVVIIPILCVGGLAAGLSITP